MRSDGGRKQKPNGRWVLLSPMYKTTKSAIANSYKNWEVAYINDEGTQKLLARRGSGYFKESLEVSGVFLSLIHI